MTTHSIQPTLHTGLTNVLTSPSGIAQYMITFFFSNPGGVCDVFPDMLSWRTLSAKYDQDASGLCAAIAAAFEHNMRRHFPSSNMVVTCDHEFKSESNSFVITVDIADAQNRPVIPSRSIAVTGDNQLTLLN